MTAFKYSAATLALLFASSMAYAQSATTVQPQPGAENKIECPAPGSLAEADMPVECKNNDNTAATEIPKQDNSTAGTATTTEVPKQYNATGSETTPASDPNATGTTTTTEVQKQDNLAASSGATITKGVTTGAAPATINPASAVLASQFMGQIVYSSTNENVGEINDLVMNEDLDNVVAIIGVGGFLGIGEKDVAIPIDQITVVKDDANNMRLTIAATKEQLEAAPAFDRTALK
ncbi:MAG: PRC-barrel domain-containing protein [Hyphomicrobiales bacterium]